MPLPQRNLRRAQAAADRAIHAMGGATAAARLALPPTYTEAELTRMKDLIYKWKRVGVPPHWANWVNDQTGISRHELCPTVFRPED